MHATSVPPQPCPTRRALLGTLWYFEIFQHPLTAAELLQFSNCATPSLEKITKVLHDLVAEGTVFQSGMYYQTKPDPAWVPRRLANNQRADSIMPIAHRMARFIGAFPFIRAVFVSGSLSKHCMAPDSDIDFFIITSPGRLWLARTLLVVFKKLVLFNSHKYFCVNYFVDTEHLEIDEKNLFTATETVTLLPLYGRPWYETFCKANNWAWAQFPNLPKRPTDQIPELRPSFLKKILEFILNSPIGNRLDLWSMRLTVRYWRRKFRNMDDRTFDQALKSRRYISKHHPMHFQKKVLDAYAQIQEANRQN
jgi:hypothetical protein